jgi:hypothetical protein
VIPAAEVSSWTANTLVLFQSHVLNLGIKVITSRNITSVGRDDIELECVYTDQVSKEPVATLVMVTSRAPDNYIYLAMTEYPDKLDAAGIKSVTAIGDCSARQLSPQPSTMATALRARWMRHRRIRTCPFDVKKYYWSKLEIMELANA